MSEIEGANYCMIGDHRRLRHAAATVAAVFNVVDHVIATYTNRL